MIYRPRDEQYRPVNRSCGPNPLENFESFTKKREDDDEEKQEF